MMIVAGIAVTTGLGVAAMYAVWPYLKSRISPEKVEDIMARAETTVTEERVKALGFNHDSRYRIQVYSDRIDLLADVSGDECASAASDPQSAAGGGVRGILDAAVQSFSSAPKAIVTAAGSPAPLSAPAVVAFCNGSCPYVFTGRTAQAQ